MITVFCPEMADMEMCQCACDFPVCPKASLVFYRELRNQPQSASRTDRRQVNDENLRCVRDMLMMHCFLVQGGWPAGLPECCAFALQRQTVRASLLLPARQ